MQIETREMYIDDFDAIDKIKSPLDELNFNDE